MVLTFARTGGVAYVELRRPASGRIDSDTLAGRYLAASELARYGEKGERSRLPFLLGRIAAKRAVLACLGSSDLLPGEVVVTNDDLGRPRVEPAGDGRGGQDVEVSISHKPAIAVALAWSGRHGPEGAPLGVGVDVEQVEQRSSSFERAALTSFERALPVLERRSLWLARLWAVKEAAAKATGRGLQGRPKDFEIEAVHGRRLRCNGRWVATHTVAGDGLVYVVARTDPPAVR